jgi:hypothetical protein
MFDKDHKKYRLFVQAFVAEQLRGRIRDELPRKLLFTVGAHEGSSLRFARPRGLERGSETGRKVRVHGGRGKMDQCFFSFTMASPNATPLRKKVLPEP